MSTEILDFNTLPLGNHIQRVNVAFRQQMQDEQQRLLTEAGSCALEYVLDDAKTGARERALCLKEQASGVAAALNYYDGSVRYYESYTAFLAEVRRQLSSYQEYCMKEARSTSLEAVAVHDAGKQAELTLTARAAHAKSQGAQYVLDQFAQAFEEVRARIEREAAPAAAKA